MLTSSVLKKQRLLPLQKGTKTLNQQSLERQSSWDIQARKLSLIKDYILQ